MIVGLLVRIDSYLCLQLARSVVCRQCQAPKSWYFDTTFKNIQFFMFCFNIRYSCLNVLPKKSSQHHLLLKQYIHHMQGQSGIERWTDSASGTPTSWSYTLHCCEYMKDFLSSRLCPPTPSLHLDIYGKIELHPYRRE